jgi:DNA-binding NarL/FixJ family response regulator
MATGALGYVVKGRIASDPEPAIRKAVAGRIFISPALESGKRDPMPSVFGPHALDRRT